jgi:hypothetical protein
VLNVRIETPSGAESRGYDRDNRAAADDVFEMLVAQIKDWRELTATVVMYEDGTEVRREKVDAAG